MGVCHAGGVARLRAITVTIQHVPRCCVTRRIPIVPFSQDESIVRDLIQLSDAGLVGTEGQEPLACVRRTVLGILCASDADIVSKSGEWLAKIMTGICIEG